MTTQKGGHIFLLSKGFELEAPGTGKGIPPEAHPASEEARAEWEEKRSISTERERDDYARKGFHFLSHQKHINSFNRT